MVIGEAPPWRKAVQVAALGVAVGTALCAVATGPVLGWRLTLPTAVVVTTVLVVIGCWPASRPRLAWAAVTASAASLVGTPLVGDAVGGRATGLLTLVETLALMVLIFITVRFVAIRPAVLLGVLLGVAEATLSLRLGRAGSVTEAVGQCAFWSLGAVAAAVSGGYLRALDTRRLRSVHAARRAQRMEIARDLHDFVAHDISGIIVLAQAAQLVGTDRPEQLLTVLTRIEQAGLRALASMDRTVRMLNGSTEAPRRSRFAEPVEPSTDPEQPVDDHRTYDLDDLPDLVERFRAGGTARVELDLAAPPELLRRLPRETAGTAYRVVVEALTNVRRHAPSADRVAVRVATAAGGTALTVSVTNSAGGGATGGSLDTGRRDGGLGLVGLTERVAAVGGTFTAGPGTEGGWRVSAVLPVDPD